MGILSGMLLLFGAKYFSKKKLSAQDTSSKTFNDVESKRFKMPIYTAIILRKGNQVLLMKRSLSVINGGLYAFPGGGIDGSETITTGTIRESHEELGITLHAEDVKFAHVQHVKTQRQDEYVCFFFQATHWLNEPAIMEPEKCDELVWFDIDNLPETLLPAHKHVIIMIEKNSYFNEFGW